jgi:hypothetical protein
MPTNDRPVDGCRPQRGLQAKRPRRGEEGPIGSSACVAVENPRERSSARLVRRPPQARGKGRTDMGSAPGRGLPVDDRHAWSADTSAIRASSTPTLRSSSARRVGYVRSSGSGSSTRSQRATTSLIAPNQATPVSAVSIGGIAPVWIGLVEIARDHRGEAVVERVGLGRLKTRPAPIASTKSKRAMVRCPAEGDEDGPQRRTQPDRWGPPARRRPARPCLRGGRPSSASTRWKIASFVRKWK